MFLIFICNFNYPWQALVLWVNNVVVDLFACFCHRNQYNCLICKHAKCIKVIFRNYLEMLRGDWGFSWAVFLKYFKTPLLYDAKSTLQSEYFAVVSTTTVMTSEMRQYLPLREVWENRSPAILTAGEKRRFHQFTKR